MIKKISSILAEGKGAATTQAAGIIIVMMMLFSLVYLYARVTAITSGIHGSVRNAVIDAVNSNYEDPSYTGMREGNSGAYTLDDSDSWQDASVDSDVGQRLCDVLSLNNSDDALERVDSSGSQQYSISNLAVTVKNPPLCSNDTKLYAKATYTLHVPVKFFLVELPPLSLPMSASAEMEQKF